MPFIPRLKSWVFPACFYNNQKPDTTKTGNSGQDCRDIPVVHRQQTLQKRLPQCRLELLPELLAANEAPREVNIYYGRVLCEVVSDKTPYKGADVKVLVVKDIVTKKVIMGLTMSLVVWSHFTTDTQALLQTTLQPVHIAFLGSPSSLKPKKLELSHMCYLRKSTFLQILEGWIA